MHTGILTVCVAFVLIIHILQLGSALHVYSIMEAVIFFLYDHIQVRVVTCMQCVL